MTQFGTNREDLETWENISASRYVLKKFSVKGDIIDEVVGGKRRFHVTTRERQLNQEMIAEAKMDPFSNGMFAPVRLVESSEDAEQIASNPNLIGEEEMAALIKGRVDALKKRLAQIENHIVLERMLEVAKEQDAQASKFEAISARLAEVNPQTHVEIEAPVIR